MLNRPGPTDTDLLPRNLRWVQLTAALARGSSAAAKYLKWNGSAWVVTTTTLTVYDALSQFQGIIGQNLWVGWSPTNSRWEVVIGGCEQMLAKTDASHAKGASGTVSVWIGTPGSETDSTYNVTAYNRFGDVASGIWVWIAWNTYGWYLTAKEC